MHPTVFALIVLVVQLPGVVLAWRFARPELGLVAAGFAVVSAVVILALAILSQKLAHARLRATLSALLADPDLPSPPAGSAEMLDAASDMRAALRASRERERELGELREDVRRIRHDVRGALSPALLTSDRLGMNGDPAIRRAGDTVARSVDRAITLLQSLKLRTPEPEPTASNPGIEENAPDSSRLFGAGD